VRKYLFYILLIISSGSFAQTDSMKMKSASDVRKWMVGGGSVTAYGTSFFLLSKAWYDDYARSFFHTYNDAGEWMQMDKIGHAWSVYNTSRATSALWNWAGVHNKNAVVFGTAGSLLYMLSIEYLDGRSAEWGWSWPDVAANFFGGILFASQELKWKEQKIQLKFSSHRNHYPSPLQTRANDLFGQTLPERLLKDYNAQTYWLSLNLKSLFKTDLPAWLNISVGYGAQGMFGGYENIAYDKGGNVIFDRRDIKRYRQWYLSPDIDLTKINTGSKLLKTVLFVLNAVKIPAPSLELSNGKIKGNWLQF
jgi:uncharacterized protein YfiM (DUF2279 family)